ncbi:hypothetical protein ACMFMG_000661 [Clarireedia jacksonii]
MGFKAGEDILRRHSDGDGDSSSDAESITDSNEDTNEENSDGNGDEDSDTGSRSPPLSMQIMEGPNPDGDDSESSDLDDDAGDDSGDSNFDRDSSLLQLATEATSSPATSRTSVAIKVDTSASPTPTISSISWISTSSLSLSAPPHTIPAGSLSSASTRGPMVEPSGMSLGSAPALTAGASGPKNPSETWIGILVLGICFAGLVG